MRRKLRQRFDAQGGRVGGVIGVGERALEQRETDGQRVGAPVLALSHELRQTRGVPAGVAQARGIFVDVSLDERFEIVVAQQDAKRRKILVEKFREPEAIGVHIDAHHRGTVGLARRRDNIEKRAVFRVAGQDRRLEQALQFGELHAALRDASAAIAASMSRMRWSSPSNSEKGGKLSSRSIITETSPKRRRALS